MSTSNRMTLVKIHMWLAAFLFPAVTMFLVTGGLYTWGVKGSYSDEVHHLQLQQPLMADAAELQQLVERELQQRSIDAPSGHMKVKKAGTSFKAEWTGSERDVVLEPTGEPMSARLIVKDTSWYRTLVQLHKAKGGQPFKVYAAVLSVSLFAILATGFVIAFQMPRHRRSAASAAIAGVVLFLVMVWSS